VRNAVLDAYLSPAHRDAAGVGCPTADLLGDAARTEPEASEWDAYATGVEGMLKKLGSLDGKPAHDAENLFTLSTMVGALLLSRATAGDLSDAFLASARVHLAKV
jgi:TetR/AcrR family transcriptional repressor of nem operon